MSQEHITFEPSIVCSVDYSVIADDVHYSKEHSVLLTGIFIHFQVKEALLQLNLTETVIVLRRTVFGDNVRCFDNLRRSHPQGQLICAVSVNHISTHVFDLIG